MSRYCIRGCRGEVVPVVSMAMEDFGLNDVHFCRHLVGRDARVDPVHRPSLFEAMQAVLNGISEVVDLGGVAMGAESLVGRWKIWSALPAYTKRGLLVRYVGRRLLG